MKSKDGVLRLDGVAVLEGLRQCLPPESLPEAAVRQDKKGDTPEGNEESWVESLLLPLVVMIKLITQQQQ